MIINVVKDCKNFKEGKCSYNENCWFKHQGIHKKENENIEDVDNENNAEMMKKIFEIVEKFTKRIVDVEDMVKKTVTKM